MATISWGKCNIAIAEHKDASGAFAETSPFYEIATPVNGSTSVNIEDGEKHEAEIEGGGNEAVRYDDDKVSVEFDVRRAKGRLTVGTDGKFIGQIPGEYAFVLQPEDPTAPGILLERCTIKRGLSFTSSDGIYDHYTLDALVPNKGGAVKIGYSQVEEWKTGNKNAIVSDEGTVSLGTKMTGGNGAKWTIKFKEDKGVFDFA